MEEEHPHVAAALVGLDGGFMADARRAWRDPVSGSHADPPRGTADLEALDLGVGPQSSQSEVARGAVGSPGLSSGAGRSGWQVLQLSQHRPCR
jgi:hypothetical protein